MQHRRRPRGHLPLSRGLTRRIQRLLDAGAVDPGLLAAAGREADLLEHPYVGIEHIELAGLGAEGRGDAYAALKASLPVRGMRRRWWRPRGSTLSTAPRRPACDPGSAALGGGGRLRAA